MRKKENKINHFKYLKWILPIIFLICCGFVLYLVTYKVASVSDEQMRTKAELNAVTYANRMQEDINKAVSITETLKQILISEDGDLQRFDSVADDMMDDYVQSIQLAPEGVVTNIYPLEGNEAGLIDLVNDEKRGSIVNYGINNNAIVMQGPFELKQGGYGIAVRNPVYLDEDDGQQIFWGLTIVIIRVPQLFDNTFRALEDFGYEYNLLKTESPLSSDYNIIDASRKQLVNPVVYRFRAGSCNWKLEVMPVDGWKHTDSMYFICWSGAVLILLPVCLAYILMINVEQRHKYKELAITDTLTGLYNRTGFNEKMEKYLSNSAEKEYVVVLLDIDNFKFINDMYGHDIGDKVLKNLASALKKEFPQKSIIGRNGGDEFCMILEDTSADDVKMKLAYFVENSVHECICDGEIYEYSISMGYAEYPKDTSKNTELLRLADIALYDVKLKGKSGVQQYKDNMCSTKRAQLGFNLDDISDNLPGAFFIYKADVNDDKILYTNQEMIQLVGCTDLDDFYEFSKRHFRNLIKPDEVERVENSIWKQISYNDGMTEDFVIYHICTKNGQYKKVIDYGRIVENNYYGKVFYVLLIDYDSIKE